MRKENQPAEMDSPKDWDEVVSEISAAIEEPYDTKMRKFIVEAHLSTPASRFSYMLEIVRTIAWKGAAGQVKTQIWFAGYVIAAILAWDRSHSVLWTVLQGALSWIYVGYRLFTP